MTEGMVDHACACYANGHNPAGSFFTVLSRDSYFNVYQLRNGYISLRYVDEMIMSGRFNAHTLMPVFNVEKFCKHLGLEWTTYFYFCVLCGDYDAGFDRNLGYFNSLKTNEKISTTERSLNWMSSLRDHLRGVESELKETGYERIRINYEKNGLLAKIDFLFDCFAFRNVEFKFDSGDANDFDRFILTLKDMGKIYLQCFVEDYTESSVFEIARKFDLLKTIYLVYNLNNPEAKKSKIVEYSRCGNPNTVGNGELV